MERVTAHTTHRNGGMGFWLKQVSQWSTRITDRPENPGTSNHGTPPSRGRSCQTPEQKRFLLVVFFSCPAFLADPLVGEFLDFGKDGVRMLFKQGAGLATFQEDTHFFLGTG